MTDDEIRATLTAGMNDLDLLQMMKDVFLDGYDTYDDYVRYGDAFVRLRALPPRPMLMLPPHPEPTP